MQPDRNERLCILGLPTDMGFAELCTFIGPYFSMVSVPASNPYRATTHHDYVLITLEEARSLPPRTRVSPPFVQQVNDIRLVRREGGKAIYLALLTFMGQGAADDFYRELNGQPV